MKRIFKKNQLIIAALAIMIAAAGYLNYSGRIFGEENVLETTNDLASQELLDISEEDLASASGDIESQDGEVEGTPGEAVLTSGNAVVADAKVTREQVRAKNKEALLEIIENEAFSECDLLERIVIPKNDIPAQAAINTRGVEYFFSIVLCFIFRT